MLPFKDNILLLVLKGISQEKSTERELRRLSIVYIAFVLTVFTPMQVFMLLEYENKDLIDFFANIKVSS